MPHPFEQDFDGPIDITVGGLRAQAGNVLLTFANEPVKFYITPKEVENLTLTIWIDFDHKELDNIQMTTTEDGHSMIINIPSSVSEFTIGAGEPMRIGVASGKALYIVIKCIDMGDDLKALYFTIYTKLND